MATVTDQPIDLAGIAGDRLGVWHVSDTNQIFAVWQIPGTDIPMLYEIPDLETYQGYLGSGRPVVYNRELTSTELDSTGALNFGSIFEVPAVKHPFAGWLDQVKKETAVQPWLSDPEMLAVWAEAQIEGRDVSEAEWATTTWWQTHSEAQRSWLILVSSDPATADQRIADATVATRNAMISAGIDRPPDSIVSLISNNVVTGEWTATYAAEQVRGLADPFAGVEADPAIASLLGGGQVDTTRDQEQAVRELVATWLGPAYASQWSEADVQRWAGEFRNDPDAETNLVESLRGQRLALFPTYENPNLTYTDIAAPWKQVWQQEWGSAPDEADPLFNQIVNLNDLNAARQTLRSEGLTRGIGQVTERFASDLGRAFGGNVRRAIA